MVEIIFLLFLDQSPKHSKREKVGESVVMNVPKCLHESA